MSEVRFRIIYRLATLLLPDNKFLYQCLTDSTLKNYFKVSAFSIFAKLAGDIGETIVVPSANTLHSVFRSTLNDDTLDLELRITAMRAVIRFIQHMPSSNEKEHFQDLLPGMMKTLTDVYLSKDIKDDPAWHSAETASDITGITLKYCVGTTCLARFSLALGGKSVAHVAIEQLSAYSAAPEWEKRHAQIAQGCLKAMIKNLEQVMAMVLNCFQDPHPRVRWAACYAICQLLHDFSPHLQEEYHNQVIPAWFNCLPIKANLIEDKLVHELLCSMVERLLDWSDRELLGSNYQSLPKVVSVFAEVLCYGEDLATEETVNRMINVLRNLQQTLPPDTMESAWSYILPRQEMELKSLLSPKEDANF
ncbi:hypothetical protein RND71_002615 [Anisodus tanguticus]|uniref:IPO4/5-like TPR repeats domain-containing protein n=1 Tax=Anisodus tanguticus TaxID=243964 RepID=A0AAE1VS47_9SOLA|nr:hypothetical protein RND71_002615 [Anisodus tanguticus]